MNYTDLTAAAQQDGRVMHLTTELVNAGVLVPRIQELILQAIPDTGNHYADDAIEWAVGRILKALQAELKRALRKEPTWWGARLLRYLFG